MKPFIEDAEFIEFLKNISLFVTSSDTPSKSDKQAFFHEDSLNEGSISSGNQASKLYENLQYLRDRFKEYQCKKNSTLITSQALTLNNTQTTLNQSSAFKQPSPNDLSESMMSKKNKRVLSQSKEEHLRQLPEKQRKQIEFIDEIYDKLILNKGSSPAADNSSSRIESYCGSSSKWKEERSVFQERSNNEQISHFNKQGRG